MGCCKSSANIETIPSNSTNSTRIDPPLTQVEMTELELFLSGIPHHCREIIINLPVRQLLNVSQYHKMALDYGLKRNWSLAISYEHRVIKGLQGLLPMNKDHYIFSNFYSILSASFLALGQLEAAIEGIYIALAIVLKHTPMDYRTISKHYYYLANVFKVLQDWKATAQYLIKAIDIARLMTDLDLEYMDMLETELTKQRMMKDVIHNLTLFEVTRKQGESDQDFLRRRTAEIITSYDKYSTPPFNEDDVEHFPGKEIESRVTNEIRQDVLMHLQNKSA